jgi:hypothetical protein
MIHIDCLSDVETVIKNDDGTYTVKYKEYKSKSGQRLVQNNWREVPRYDKKGRKLDPEEYKKMVIAKNGMRFWLSTEECEFLGSSETLVSTEALKRMMPEIPNNSDTLFNGLNIYEKSIKGHSYVIGVDPAKDGIDSFAIQVIDITSFPFKQVASAKLDVDYLMMPEHLEILGLHYNEAFMVIENNEGAGQSIADILYMQYEYVNLYRDRTDNDNMYKTYAGFRTTLKTRPLILNIMKIFIEEDKLLIQDNDTINEFYTFTKSEKVTVKYEAEDGTHDDMVMALALCFAPFNHIKAFDDLELFLQAIHADIEVSEDSQIDTYMSLLDTGSGVDDATDESIYTVKQRALEHLNDFNYNDNTQYDEYSDLLSLRDY